MPGAGSDVATAAGLVAAGVGLGGVMMFLGFTMGSQGYQSSQQDASPAVRKLGGGRRRRLRNRQEEEEEEDNSDASPALRRRGSKSLTVGRQVNLEDGVISCMGAGWSMIEAREMAETSKAASMKRCPADVLAELQRGNVRFWTGQATRPEKSAFERRALISTQFPSTAILGCSDSRVPLEIVFDQGLGDMFVIRVAGNCLDTTTAGSLQYAVHHLKVKCLIVMGHEGCGAVKAAQLPIDAINKEPESLSTLLKKLRRGLDAADLGNVQDSKAQDREAVTTNVKAQVENLVRDKGIMSKVRSGELIMLGAFYEISSGIVDFFHEVSGGDDDEQPSAVRRAPSQGVLTRLPSRGLLPRA